MLQSDPVVAVIRGVGRDIPGDKLGNDELFQFVTS